jgi:hypothetical protein
VRVRSAVAGLLLKELLQHGPGFLALLLLVLPLSGLLLLTTLAAPRDLSLLEVHATFVRFFLPVFAFALAYQLVVREWNDRTITFLGALPVDRRLVVGVKLLLGLSVLLALGAASLAVSLAAAAFRDPLTLRWVTLVAVRTALFATTLWALFFALGFLGRWQPPVYVTLLLSVLLLAQSGGPVLRFGPFGLVGDTFVLEREVFPLSESVWSVALAALLFGLALTVALARDGSLAEGLTGRMSRRELTVMSVVVAVAFTLGEVMPGAGADDAPFAFRASSVRHDGPVHVLFFEASQARRAARLAATLRRDRARVMERFPDLRPVPEIFVSLRETFEPDRVEAERTGEPPAVLARGAYVHPDFDERGLRRHVVGTLLHTLTDDRVAHEPLHWVEIATDDVILGPPTPEDLARAAFVARHRAPRLASLARSEGLIERFGYDAAAAWMSAAGWGIQRRAGDEAWWRFARSVIRRPPRLGVVAMVRDALEPVPDRLAAHAGLRGVDDAMAGVLASARLDLPPGEATVDLRADEDGLPVVTGSFAANRPLPEGSRCRLLAVRLGRFDGPLGSEADPDDAGVPCGGRARFSDTAPAPVGPGDRAFIAVEVHTPALGTFVRLRSERVEVE